LFANSRNVADRLWNSLRLRSDVLYHRSPATDALLDREPSDLGDYIFYPSRLESLKRQGLAIDAMRHVRTPVKLVLVGRGPQERMLRARVQLHGLQDRVRMEIGVSDERLHELYLGALGVFFGAYDEDFGYVTIEGYAAARPVITLSDGGGPLEFVEDGVTGLVSEPTPRAIAAAFDRLWSERARGAAWGQAGKKVLLDRVPAWPDVVERLLR
jgi:glycosyltransferase involved in cell wall biosynthesis